MCLRYANPLVSRATRDSETRNYERSRCQMEGTSEVPSILGSFFANAKYPFPDNNLWPFHLFCSFPKPFFAITKFTPLIYRCLLLLTLFLAGGKAEAQTLQEYLDSARANNPVSQENQNLSAIAALEVDKAKAMYYLPEVSASGNFLYAPVVKGVGYE